MDESKTRPRRSRKRRPNWPVRLVLLGILGSFILLALITPVVRFRLDTEGFQRERWDLLTELMLTHSMAWFIILWVFFFGACLGSFLNVVAYRIPNGLTILGNSRCPWCLVPIQSRHNFPILGWLMLRGRCAACRLPIAFRYVLVEIAAGAVLVWLFLFELVSDGSNLPSDHDYRIAALFQQLASGSLDGLGNYDWSLVRIFLVHGIVGYTLLTAALMRLDGLRLPLIWKLLHWGAVMILLTIWPTDFEFARASFQPTDQSWEWFQRIDFQLTGMILGAFLGFQFQQVSGDRHAGLLFAFVLIGTCCGILATLSIGILFLILIGLTASGASTRPVLGHPLFLLLVAFLVQIAGWRFLESFTWWPNQSANTLTLIGFLLPSTLTTISVTSLRLQSQPDVDIDGSNTQEEPTEAGGSDSSSTQ